MKHKTITKRNKDEHKGAGKTCTQHRYQLTCRWIFAGHSPNHI